MATISALSSTRAVNGLMNGPPRHGDVIGDQCIRVGDYVFSVTPPWKDRMPNGIEAEVTLRDDVPIVIGAGCLKMDETRVLPGPAWNARPRVNYLPVISQSCEPSLERLVGWGPGFLPSGDLIICGYLAGLILFGLSRSDSFVRASETCELGRTLIRHAADGELPEPAHRLLTNAASVPLLAWGGDSGAALLYGLALAASQVPVRQATRAVRDSFDAAVATPEGPRRFSVTLVSFPTPQ